MNRISREIPDDTGLCIVLAQSSLVVTVAMFQEQQPFLISTQQKQKCYSPYKECKKSPLSYFYIMGLWGS